MLILLNPAAGGGRAFGRWVKVAPRLALGNRFRLHVLDEKIDSLLVLADAIRSGETEIVAAGGDGTVNAVVNVLMNPGLHDVRGRITLGAIGLGVNNDFHRPSTATVDGCSYKLDFARARLRDIGMLTVEVHGKRSCRYFITRACIGAAADATREFNEPNRLPIQLKRLSNPAAHLYAAIKAAAHHDNVSAMIASPETGTLNVSLSSLAVTRDSPGGLHLRRGQAGGPDSGMLSIHLSHGMSNKELVPLLYSSSRGGLGGHGKTRSWPSSSLSVWTAHAVTVEFDGEIISSPCVQLDVIRDAFRVCQ